MGRSLDLREQALKALMDGMSRSQICLAFGIHRTTLRRWQLRQQSGRLASSRPSGARRKLSPADEAQLLEQLRSYPHATVSEHLSYWQEGRGQPISRATMGRVLLRLRQAQSKQKERKSQKN